MERTFQSIVIPIRWMTERNLLLFNQLSMKLLIQNIKQRNMKTQITIFCTFLFIIFFFVSNAQEPDTLKPIYLEGTNINVAGVDHNSESYREIKDSIVIINNHAYRIYSQSINKSGIRIRDYFVVCSYLSCNAINDQISRLEIYDIDGSSIFKYDCHGYPEECDYEIRINFKNHSVIVCDANLRFYNDKGILVNTIENVNFDYFVNDSRTFVSYVRKESELSKIGVANFEGEILWEKDQSFDNGFNFIDISENGHLLILSDCMDLYSYSQAGNLIWEKPSFKTFHPYNNDGTILVTSDRTPRLIDNKTGEFIPTRIREELKALGNPQLSHQRKFIPDSDLFAVLAYYKTHEEILIFNTNGKCIAKKKIDKKYITEDSSILRYRKNENIISVLQNGQVIDKIILNE